jgi:hypothetical protein
VAYSPQSNGKIERVNLEVLKILRILIKECGFEVHEFKKVLQLCQYVLNNTPRRRLKSMTHDEVFLGSKTTELQLIVHPLKNVPTVLSQVTTEKIVSEVEKLRNIIEERRVEVYNEQSKRDNNDELMNSEFNVGDYVLVSKKSKRRHKLESYFAGPFVVGEIINKYVYGVIIGNKINKVHVSRIYRYCMKDMLLPVKIQEFSKRSLKYFQVEKVVRTEYNPTLKKQFSLVQFLGIEESIWIPTEDLE